MSKHSEWLCQIPAGEGVGAESGMNQGDSALYTFIIQIKKVLTKLF
jgi:hypothetical protein